MKSKQKGHGDYPQQGNFSGVKVIRIGLGTGDVSGGKIGWLTGGDIIRTVCGPCENGRRQCVELRSYVDCETIHDGITAEESPLGIESPPIVVCGWKSEVLQVWEEPCVEEDQFEGPTEVFLPFAT